MQFTRAIVRAPAGTFAQGLTDAGLGAPDLDLARAQHARYCAALEDCGVQLVRLPEEPAFPDSTFVEDTAVLFGDHAVLTRPGAASRRGEVDRIEGVVRERFADVAAIVAPGMLDGGDVCQAGAHFFIGVSGRTNEAGARQLAAIVRDRGGTAALVDIRGVPGILHLKSGVSYLGDERVALIDALIEHDAFTAYERVRVPADEGYAANCVRVNDRIVVAAGHPRFAATLSDLGYRVTTLDMSEFRKMDGALTCLSLRF